MKITYIVSKFPKLSETFVLGQITDLIDRGHDVEIISIEKPTDGTVHEEVYKYNLLEKKMVFLVMNLIRALFILMMKGVYILAVSMV